MLLTRDFLAKPQIKDISLLLLSTSGGGGRGVLSKGRFWLTMALAAELLP